MTVQNKTVLKSKLSEFKEQYDALRTHDEVRQFAFKVATELQAWWATNQFGGGKLTRGDVDLAIRELGWESPCSTEAMTFSQFILGNKDKIEAIAKGLKAEGLKGQQLSSELHDKIVNLSHEVKLLKGSLPKDFDEWERLRKRLNLHLPMGKTVGTKNKKTARENILVERLHPNVTSEGVPAIFKEKALKDLPALIERLSPLAEKYMEDLQLAFPLATYEMAQALLSGNEANQQLVVGDLIARAMYSAALYRLERGEL